MNLVRLLYRGATGSLSPLLPTLMKRRVARGKEDAARVPERYGKTSLERPDGALVWLHGASVGEAGVLRLLIAQLAAARPDLSFLVTTQTLTSASLFDRDLPPRTVHQMAVLDTPLHAARFLDQWWPDLAVFAEGEVWPNLLDGLKQRDIPAALVNARMTQKSLDGWARFPVFAASVFQGFKTILAADDNTATGLSRLSGRPVTTVGNLKHSAKSLRVDASELTTIRTALGDRPVFAALSTHAGEDALALSVFDHLKVDRQGPSPVLLIVPRHPERADAIAGLLAGRRVARRSKGEGPSLETDVFLGDTLGEMGLYVRLADVVFLGGGGLGAKSFHGHNPLEPFRLNRFVISGADVANFAAEFEILTQTGFAAFAEDRDELVRLVRPWMDTPKPELPDRSGAAARLDGAQALKTTTETLLPLIARDAPHA